MRRTARVLGPFLAGTLLCGCASQADIDQAINDDLRYTTRVVGFALDASVEALQTRRALLRAFEGDPRFTALERELGTIAEVDAKLERIKEARRSLLEEGQRLGRRYQEGE